MAREGKEGEAMKHLDYERSRILWEREVWKGRLPVLGDLGWLPEAGFFGPGLITWQDAVKDFDNEQAWTLAPRLDDLLEAIGKRTNGRWHLGWSDSEGCYACSCFLRKWIGHIGDIPLDAAYACLMGLKDAEKEEGHE